MRGGSASAEARSPIAAFPRTFHSPYQGKADPTERVQPGLGGTGTGLTLRANAFVGPFHPTRATERPDANALHMQGLAH